MYLLERNSPTNHLATHHHPPLSATSHTTALVSRYASQMLLEHPRAVESKLGEIYGGKRVRNKREYS
jgi:hypothetical protein